MSKRTFSSSSLGDESPAPALKQQRIDAYTITLSSQTTIQVADYGLANWSPQNTDRLFHHVLDRASQEKGAIDFQSFVEAKSRQFLLQLLRTTCADGCRLVDSGRIRDKQSLINDLRDDVPYYNKEAFYLMKLLDTDANAADWLKLVVGQTDTYESRKTTYISTANSMNSTSTKWQFIHDIWTAKPTRYAKFGILGKYRDLPSDWSNKDKRCWKNIVEMYFTVAIQTLPSLWLAKDKGTGWNPDWFPKCAEVGLQQGYPIHQIENGAKDKTNVYMWLYSGDPEVRDAYKVKNNAQLDAIRPMAQAALWQGGHQKTIQAAQTRENSTNRDVHWRQADATLGDLTSVKCICSTCKTFEWTDNNPKYSTAKGIYLTAKNKQCLTCKTAKATKNGYTYFKPVDGSMNFESYQKYMEKINKAKKKEKAAQAQNSGSSSKA